MRKRVKRLIEAVYVFLCIAPPVVWAGYLLIGDYAAALAGLAVLMPVAYALSYVPGYIGGKAKQIAAPVSAARNDPNPDHNLRSDSPDAIAVRRRFPIRLTLCASISALLFAAIALLPLPLTGQISLINRLLLSGIAALILPISLFIISRDEIVSGQGMIVGFACYAISGIVLYAVDLNHLSGIIMAMGAAFLIISGLYLSEKSLNTGAASRSRVPAGIRNRNRVIMAVMAAVIAFIVMFDDIRLWAREALKATVRLIFEFIALLGSLMAPGEEVPAEGGGGGMDMLSGLPPGEASPFWTAMEKVMVVIAVLIAIAIVFIAGRVIFKKLKILIGRMLNFMRRFSESIGEEYRDERESLLDWGELQKTLGSELKKRWERLTRREPKYEQLDARGRVRYIVRALYRKTNDALDALTIREAASKLNTGNAHPEHLTVLYERARYAEDAPDITEADALRREVRL